MSASDDDHQDAAGLKDDYSRTDARSVVADEPTQTLDLYGDPVDIVYQAKAKILNDQMQEIGMGKYQVETISHNTPSPNDLAAVVFVCRGRVWLVFVSNARSSI